VQEFPARVADAKIAEKIIGPSTTRHAEIFDDRAINFSVPQEVEKSIVKTRSTRITRKMDMTHGASGERPTAPAPRWCSSLQANARRDGDAEHEILIGREDIAHEKGVE